MIKNFTDYELIIELERRGYYTENIFDTTYVTHALHELNKHDYLTEVQKMDIIRRAGHESIKEYDKYFDKLLMEIDKEILSTKTIPDRAPSQFM